MIKKILKTIIGIIIIYGSVAVAIKAGLGVQASGLLGRFLPV